MNIEDNNDGSKEEGLKMEVAERYCTVEESLIESCKQMKLMREGKMPKKTWKELRQELKEMKKSENI